VGKIASGIEQAIFNLYKGDIGAKYKAQVRSRYSNGLWTVARIFKFN
jgi:hypothetical protein